MAVDTTLPAFFTEGAEKANAFLVEVAANHKANLRKWVAMGKWLARAKDELGYSERQIMEHLKAKAPLVADLPTGRRNAIVWLFRSQEQVMHGGKPYPGWKEEAITPAFPWEMRAAWYELHSELRRRRTINRASPYVVERSVRRLAKSLDVPADHPLVRRLTEVAKRWSKGRATLEEVYELIGEPNGFAGDSDDQPHTTH